MTSTEQKACHRKLTKSNPSKFNSGMFNSSKFTSWFLQAIFFVIFFLSISWWQTKDMLAKNTQLSQTQLILPTLEGELMTYDLSNNNKKTLLYFVAPWCGICHLAIDNLEAIYQSKSKELAIFIIALGWDSKESVDEFIEQHELTIPVLLGSHETQQRFKVTAFPSYYLISKNGSVLSKDSGYSTELGLRARQAL